MRQIFYSSNGISFLQIGDRDNCIPIRADSIFEWKPGQFYSFLASISKILDEKKKGSVVRFGFLKHWLHLTCSIAGESQVFKSQPFDMVFFNMT